MTTAKSDPRNAETNRKAILTKIHRVIDQYEDRGAKSPEMEQIKQIVGRPGIPLTSR